MAPKPILIIGGGLIGLCLAQALQKRNIPYRIFERDASLNHRGVGWGISFIWGQPFFHALVPDYLYAKLKDVAVNPEAEEAGEARNLTYFDMRTGKPLYEVPDSADRIRVKRHGLREALLDGVDIQVQLGPFRSRNHIANLLLREEHKPTAQWSKELSAIDHLGDGSIQATFADSTSATGSLLVGCDGSFSQVRKLLLPDTYATTLLPCLILGTTVVLSATVADPMRRLDPHYLQGGDDTQDIFFFFSFLDSPSNNNREDRQSYACQIFFCFPRRPPFTTDLPEHPVERVQYIRACAAGWAEPFSTIIQALSDDTQLAQIRVQDWVPAKSKSEGSDGQGRAWDNFSGTVTLAGDAGHPMTMFRGEAFNHGLYDVMQLVQQIEPSYTADDVPANGLNEAIDAYEAQMTSRAHAAVLLSRRACMDAFNQGRLSASSPLVSERSATSYLTQAGSV